MSRIEEGTYRVRGVVGSEQWSPEGQTPCVWIDLDLLDLGEQKTTFLYLTDGALKWTKERLRALGWRDEDGEDLSRIGDNEALARVFYEEFEGKERMKVEIVTGGGAIKMSEQASPAYKRKLGAVLRGGAVARPASPRTAAPPPASDDNIPF